MKALEQDSQVSVKQDDYDFYDCYPIASSFCSENKSEGQTCSAAGFRYYVHCACKSKQGLSNGM